MTQPRRKGTLEVVRGSMFAGKTEHTIARLRRAAAEGRKVKAFKHCIDDRYDADHLVTHRNDRFVAVRAQSAQAILDRIGDADYIAIDEGHFFKLELVPVVEQLLARGVSIIVAGISHDAWGRPFEPMPQLAAMADEVTTFEAPCRVCGKPSPYTQRNTPVMTEHMVGGLDDYEPRCKEHFTPLPGPPEQR